MKTSINPHYAAGFIAGLRAAAATVRLVSRAGAGSNFAAVIERRATNDELIIGQWRRKGIL